MWATRAAPGGGKAAKASDVEKPREQDHIFFCIPLQVGPSTPYARKVRHWMHFIVVVQAVVCGLRFGILFDFLGGFWMSILCLLGWYTLYQDVNMTYLTVWGLGCAFNGLFDLVGLILPFVLGLISFQLLSCIVRILIPFSELLGALFAWHLFRDYQSSRGVKNLPDVDPLGQLFSHDPEEALPFAKEVYSAQNAPKQVEEHKPTMSFFSTGPFVTSTEQDEVPAFTAAPRTLGATKEIEEEAPGMSLLSSGGAFDFGPVAAALRGTQPETPPERPQTPPLQPPPPPSPSRRQPTGCC